jgi:pyruvate kinase
MNRIKIVATIGPRCREPRALLALRRAGMDVARLNGSHGDLAWHSETVKMLRKHVPDVPILLDIPGRKVRTARLAHEPSFAAGDTIILTTERGHDGSLKVPLSYDGFHREVKAGCVLLADDGQLRFTVLKVRGRDVHCRTENAGTLRSRKGINTPSITLKRAVVTRADDALLAFARKAKIDFIGVSFVQSAAEVEQVRAILGAKGPKIVAKIENRPALEHVEEIAKAADAVMIDRGDLSAETAPEQVALFQKRIIRQAAAQRCPVIVATEMLHSMVTSAVPTKAEVSDISNAVLDGASAVMLSGETAVGSNPEAAVSTMRAIADASWEHQQEEASSAGASDSIPQAMGEAISLLCRRLPVTKIVAVTISGFAARAVAAHRPRQPILAVSNDAANARSFNLLPGTRGVHVEVKFSRSNNDHIPACLEALWRAKHLIESDLVLVTAVSYPRSGNRMNLIETHRVSDLRRSLGWK